MPTVPRRPAAGRHHDPRVGRRAPVGLELAVAVLLGLAALVGCSGDEGGSVEAFCPLVADRAGLAAVVDGFDPSDRDRALDLLRAARVELGELRAAAPDEIRGDLDVQIDATQTLVDALDGAPPGDPAAAVDAVRAVQDDLDEVDAASARLDAWTDTHC